ncbi:unnamed protein product [Rotaria sp. Silwood1]|nr:unnamed protein product [Rotaria sp. Silwood1]
MITHLKRYITIIQDSDVYPVIYDSNNVVLSLLPVINSKLLIRKIFKISHLLNCLGDHSKMSNLSDRSQNVSVEKKMNQRIRIEADAQMAAKLLNRMSLRTKVLDSDTLHVDIPVTRADILHFCDIAEDFAVAYGFNNIEKKTVPKTSCIGNQIGRTSLLPGLLKTLASNQGTALPIQLFEKTGSRYERCLCEIYYNHTPGFEIIHGLLDRIMTLVKVSYNENKTNDIDDYLNNQYENSAFFPDQHAEIIVYGKNLDAIGVLHPNVIEHFGLKFPCSILELNIEPFV